MRDETGFIIPGVASNPFSYINELRNLLFEFTKNKEPGKIMEYPRLNQSSLLREWNAQTVPLKPEVSRMNAALRPAFLASHDKMANFHPVGLSRENIGSNAGLGKVFRKFYTDRGMNVVNGCNRYAIFSVDVNIYDRILKVPHHKNARSRALTAHCLDLLRPKRRRQKISPVLLHQPRTMAQLQAWGGAHLDAMGAYDLRPAVPLLVSPEQIPYQVPVAPRTTHAHDDVGPRVRCRQGRTAGCLA
jgi:hypothetical protein